MGTEATDPSAETVVQTASEAAEGVLFSAYKQSAVRDYDVTVIFEDGILEVDVYLNVSEETDDGRSPETVTEQAVEAAEAAVDDLFGV